MTVKATKDNLHELLRVRGDMVHGPVVWTTKYGAIHYGWPTGWSPEGDKLSVETLCGREKDGGLAHFRLGMATCKRCTKLANKILEEGTA